MFAGTRRTLFNVLIVLSLFLRAIAQQTSPASAPPVEAVSNPTSLAASLSSGPATPLHDALMLYLKGDFDGAIGKYHELLNQKQNLPEAYAGLIRTYLKKKDVQQAADTARQALQVADAGPVRVALGEVYFRQGKILDAEAEWLKVINSGHRDPRAFLGLARVRWAFSMYRSGQAMIEKAYEFDPADPEIRRLRLGRLSRAERVKALEDYLAGENNDDSETRSSTRNYLEYLKARAKDPRGGCRLVGKIATTETPLLRYMSDANHIRAYDLEVSVNNTKSRLLLDTGASGILINRRLAERAGVTRLSDAAFGGIGDQGSQRGYIGLANTLRVGELEFQNCEVRVLDRRSVVGDDGLIGTDVFSSFLVDIDFPVEKLRLTELPKRPDGNASTISLETEREGPDNSNHEADNATPDTLTKDAASVSKGPVDAYIAPEMKSYTRIYRFGHALLVPTYIGEDNAPARLFLLDTGAFDNHVTPATAREVTHIEEDPRTKVQGVSGSVNKVYRTGRALVRFGRLQQHDQDLVAFDLTHVSDDIGTEVSGLLGFQMLRLLDIKIDYRDGLVNFDYNPKRFNH